eukprot:756662-Hanusia_phi.AAC.4
MVRHEAAEAIGAIAEEAANPLLEEFAKDKNQARRPRSLPNLVSSLWISRTTGTMTRRSAATIAACHCFHSVSVPVCCCRGGMMEGDGSTPHFAFYLYIACYQKRMIDTACE